MTIRLLSTKCFSEAVIKFAPVTVLTGVNSGGKTTVIQSLLLTKWFYDLKMLSAERLDVLAWPEGAVGGIPVGTSNEYTQTGSTQATFSVMLREGDLTLTPSDQRLGISMPVPYGRMDHIWRVSSTTMLPLKSEQSVNEHNVDSDSIWDHGHALIELSRYELKRKEGAISGGPTIRSAVEEVISNLTSGTRIELTKTGIDGIFKLAYSGTSIESEMTSPQQYGTGVTAVLPLAVHLCAALPGETIICQDPEMHLHPRGQSLLGKYLGQAALQGIHVVVETHSEHIINGIKIALLSHRASLDEYLACYFLASNGKGSSVVPIIFDERGRTTSWPRGYFDQAEQDFSELAKQGRR